VVLAATALLFALAAVGAAAGWFDRRAALESVGALLVHEDPLGPVEMMVVSNADPPADALEAAQLYHAGISRTIVVPLWISEPTDEALERLQVPHLRTTKLAKAVLTRSHVPPTAIETLSTPVDGTLAEVAEVAALARRRQPQSLLYITPRSHTARAFWVLHRELPAQIRISVRSPRLDAFPVNAWWYTRDYSREVAMEYLRWINTLILQDPWGAGSHRP